MLRNFITFMDLRTLSVVIHGFYSSDLPTFDEEMEVNDYGGVL